MELAGAIVVVLDTSLALEFDVDVDREVTVEEFDNSFLRELRLTLFVPELDISDGSEVRDVMSFPFESTKPTCACE